MRYVVSASTDESPRSQDDLPRVSVVIPVFNEERHIEDCLRSVSEQDYPRDLVEIVVADGGSTDRTKELVAQMAIKDSRLRLIENPGRNQAAGLNRAIGATTGEVVARLDGHAAWQPEHLRRCVQLLMETGADNVGGTMEAVGENPVAEAVARAWQSPFAAGGARYRYSKRQMETDTVFLGVFRREALNRVGPFREDLDQHEDYELNHRIRLTGGRVLFSPDISTRYWTRSTWASLGAQFFCYGRAKARVAEEHPGVVRPYHLLPVACVGVLTLGMFTRGSRRWVAGVATAYAAADAVASVRAGAGAKPQVRRRIPVAFAAMHIAWGAGFWTGLLERVVRHGSLSARTSEGATKQIQGGFAAGADTARAAD